MMLLLPVPAEYRFSETEILAREVVAPGAVDITIRYSGVKAAPELEEISIMHFIREW